MTDEQYLAMGKITIAHSYLSRTIFGVIGQLIHNKPEQTGLMVPYIAPFDRVRLAIRLLELDAKSNGISTSVFRRLEDCLQQVLDTMTIEFDFRETELDLSSWLESESTPWVFFNLNADAAGLDGIADNMFFQTTALISAITAYMEEKSVVIAKSDEKVATELEPIVP